MSRTFTRYAADDTRQLLASLVISETSVSDYRAAMHSLGQRIGTHALEIAPEARHHKVCVLCTVEDADFLARGIVEGLESAGLKHEQVRLACFWNERVRRFEGDSADSFDVAPIIKQYREQVDVHDAILILAKSIIRGTCVVRTNLAALLDDQVPRQIIVAAPVMLQGAPDRLAREFPKGVAEKFKYLAFAEDDKKDDQGNVIPGVGGSPYMRLGFGDKKNTFVPKIIKMRRREFQAHT